MTGAGRLAWVAAAALCLATAALPYYPFLHYPSRYGPSTPIPEKFDLAALPNKTLQVFVSDAGPTRLAAGDSFTSVVTQVRMAVKAWNDVESSELRVAFGGLISRGTPQSTPRVEVLFDDVPGVLANCGPVARLEAVNGSAGPFVPITASTCTFNRDLTQRPSFGEAFFLSLVHELGHALGLQHTLTSSAMSTELTRATTRANPLASDDVAGLSALYPTAAFRAQTGSIAGQVFLDGRGLHMASVVALAPDRPAVSALTNPDGTFRIEGLSAGHYYVYVHPLPPGQAADLGPAETVLPVDADNRPIPAGDYFETQFFPGVRDPQQAQLVQVAAGSVTQGINFLVQRRTAAPQLYAVTTYSFPGQVAVKPAHLSVNGARFLVAYASSPLRLTSDGMPTPGLNVSVLGGSPPVLQMRAYPPDTRYLQIDFLLGQAGPGPRHLMFSLGSELYVLPSAFQVVAGAPPSIASVLPGLDARGNRVVTVTGTNLMAETRIAFDGLPAQRIESLPGAVVVSPPPGAPNYQATVSALNPDGQSSLFLQAPTAAVYVYGPGEPPAISMAPSALPAGAEAMVEIAGVNTSFADGQTVVGFGSSDVAAQRVWVLSPTRLRVQLSVSPMAAAVSTVVSVVSGFQIISQPLAFQVQPANPRLPVISPQLLNPATGQPGVYAGGPAVAVVSNLPLSGPLAVPLLYLNDQQIPVTSLAPGQVGFNVPAGWPAGPAVLRLQYGPELIYPVIVTIDPPPPTVLAVTNGVQAVDALRPAKPGDYLIVVVSGLAEPGAVLAVERVRITVGGLEHQALAAAPAVTPQTAHQILFALSPLLPAGQHSLTVSLEGRTSLPFPLFVRAQ